MKKVLSILLLLAITLVAFDASRPAVDQVASERETVVALGFGNSGSPEPIENGGGG